VVTALPYLVVYAGLAVFALAVAARVVMWVRMPLHLRWELYPIPHEGGGRARYGGSYLEQSEWWTKARQVSLSGELKAMVAEILFLAALREHNRKLWTRSFPFHFGLYLVAACTVLMMTAGVLGAVAPGVMAGALGRVVRVAVPVCGGSGLVLAFLGALGLLQRRLGTPELRLFATSADYFNLLLFVVVLGCALVSFLLVDRTFAGASAFVRNLMTGRLEALPGSGLQPLLPALSALLLAVLTAYIPLTHMSHFVGKYFAYHAIRWSDEPNLAGGGEEATIRGLLARPVSWSAPHIQGDGRKSWADVATEDTAK
jgi:nitrate reductase gamma subunit